MDMDMDLVEMFWRHREGLIGKSGMMGKILTQNHHAGFETVMSDLDAYDYDRDFIHREGNEYLAFDPITGDDVWVRIIDTDSEVEEMLRAFGVGEQV